jgi:hypothetical protein
MVIMIEKKPKYTFCKAKQAYKPISDDMGDICLRHTLVRDWAALKTTINGTHAREKKISPRCGVIS